MECRSHSLRSAGRCSSTFINAANILGFKLPDRAYRPRQTASLLRQARILTSWPAGKIGISGTIGTAGGTTVGVAPLVGAGTISSIIIARRQLTGLCSGLVRGSRPADKGLSLNNVFGTSGPVVNANPTMNRQYWAGAAAFLDPLTWGQLGRQCPPFFLSTEDNDVSKCRVRRPSGRKSRRLMTQPRRLMIAEASRVLYADLEEARPRRIVRADGSHHCQGERKPGTASAHQRRARPLHAMLTALSARR